MIYNSSPVYLSKSILGAESQWRDHGARMFHWYWFVCDHVEVILHINQNIGLRNEEELVVGLFGTKKSVLSK